MTPDFALALDPRDRHRLAADIPAHSLGDGGGALELFVDAFSAHHLLG